MRDGKTHVNGVFLRGVITALVTPFDADRALDLKTLRSHVEYQIEAGVEGICVLGGTGEPLALSEKERQSVVETVLDEARGRVRIIVGVLLVEQDAIVRSLDHAARCGADAGMLIAPYFTRVGKRHARQHFADIAERSNLPLVIFNSPSRAGIDLDVDFLAELARDVSAIVAVKESSGDVARTAALSQRGVFVLQGKDGIQAESWEHGATGGIVAIGNLVPSAFVSMFQAFTHRDTTRYRLLQQKIQDLETVLFSDGHPAPLKRAMEIIGRGAGPTRPPIYPVEPQHEHVFDEAVRGLLQELARIQQA